MKKRNPITLVAGFVLIVIFALLLFTYKVRKSEVAVVTLFGKVVREKTEPGLGLQWPWPIEKVYKLDQRIQNFEGKFDEVKLSDQNIIFLEVYVGWRIDNPKQFFPNFLNGSIAVAQDRLEELVRNAKTEVTKHVLSDFVSTDPKQMKFDQIEDEILRKVKSDVSTLGYGLEIEFVRIKKIGLPETVTQTVFDRMTSERKVYISQIDSAGQEAATKIKSKADSDAQKLLADASARAIEIQGEGESNSVHALQIMQQNTNLAIFILQNAALEQLTKDRATLILDQSTAPLNLLQPLPPQKFGATDTPSDKAP